MSFNVLLLIVFTLLQIGDIVTTARGFQLGGEEAMAVPAALIKNLGFWPSILAVKLIAVLIAGLITMWTDWAWIFTGVLSLIGVYVVWHNVRFIKENGG